MFAKKEIDAKKPCTLKLYFKSGSVITLENVTGWKNTHTANELTHLRIEQANVRGIERIRFFDVEQIEAMTETYA